MNKIFFLFFLAMTEFSFASEVVLKEHEKKIKNFYQIKSAVDKVSRKDLEDNLRNFLSQVRPSRLVGTEGHKKAQEYILTSLKSLKNSGSNLNVEEFNFGTNKAIEEYRSEFQKEIVEKHSPKDEVYKKWIKVTEAMINLVKKYEGKSGKNIVFEKKGTERPNDILILGAHYDTLVLDSTTLIPDTSKNMPGADNNASGVVLLLNMAKILNALDLPITVRLVFFDAEELGFMGSKAYVEKHMSDLKSKNFLGFINLLMLGHDSKRDDKDKKNGNMSLYLRDNNDDLNLANLVINGGKKTWGSIDFKPEANSFNSSSHQSFWDQGLKAVVMTQNWEKDLNPRWHTPNDFAETLNLSTWTQSFKFITGSVLSIGFNIEK